MINQMPVPPLDRVMPATANQIILAFNLSILAIAFVYLAREARRSRSQLPFILLLGGAMTSLCEPLYDVLCGVWFPQFGGHIPLVRAFNIMVPLWLLPCYSWYLAGQGYYMVRRFSRGITLPQLWLCYAAFWASNAMFELPGLMLGVYTYIGPQPLKIFGFPLWMAMTNSLIPILIGALCTSLAGVLTGARQWLIAALVPMTMALAELGAGWPIHLTLNGGQSLVVTDIAALLTLGLSLLIVYVVGLKFCAAPAAAAITERGSSSRENEPVVRSV